MSDLKEPIPLAQSKPVDGPLNKPSGSGAGVHDRSIGAIIAETRNLSADQVERVLQYQRERGIRFGEAAVALGYANAEDVLEALSKQFHYPYAPNERKTRSPELVALNQPFSSQSEVFRGIRSQITMRLYREGEPRRALAVISPDTVLTVNPLVYRGANFDARNDLVSASVLTSFTQMLVCNPKVGVKMFV